jgi:hypothetical protein
MATLPTYFESLSTTSTSVTVHAPDMSQWEERLVMQMHVFWCAVVRRECGKLTVSILTAPNRPTTHWDISHSPASFLRTTVMCKAAIEPWSNVLCAVNEPTFSLRIIHEPPCSRPWLPGYVPLAVPSDRAIATCGVGSGID